MMSGVNMSMGKVKRRVRLQAKEHGAKEGAKESDCGDLGTP